MDQARVNEALQTMSDIAMLREAAGVLDFETKRNTDNIDIFEVMIRKAFDNVTTVVAGHHIMFLVAGSPLPTEIASADTLIFNHWVAQKVWGEKWGNVLASLALEPRETRDMLLRELYANHQRVEGST